MKTAKIFGFLVGLVAAWSLASASTVDVGFTEGDPGAGPFGVNLYVRGSIYGDWAGVDANNLMTWDGDSYVWSFVIAPGTYEFKIADAGWTEGTNFGTQTGGLEPISLNTLTDMGDGCCAGNWLLTILTEQKYIFDFTPLVGSSGEGQLIITPIPAAFLLFGSALMGLGAIRRRVS